MDNVAKENREACKTYKNCPGKYAEHKLMEPFASKLSFSMKK
jgi:hypothetical protein